MADYVSLWKAADYWSGKVLHRDKKRDLVVIELNRKLPDRACPAEFLTQSAAIGSRVRALNQPGPGGETALALREGRVRSIGTIAAFFGPEPEGGFRQPSPLRILSHAPRGVGPDCGLFDMSGRVVGFSSPPDPKASAVNAWIDVTELREFFAEKKVPFHSAPEKPTGKDTKSK